jgi:GxxExxY protein
MNEIVLVQEALTRSIIGAFFRVYNALGFGYLEHLYLSALERELRNRGHTVRRELSVPVFYDGCALGMQRLDMVVDDLVVIEAKSTRELPDIAARQLFNYLRATHFELGLLLHFGPKPQFKRALFENRLKPHARRSDPSEPSNAVSPVD